MWLTLTLVKIEGPKNKQTSRIIVSRINMDRVISYFEAPKEVQEHKNENLRSNTFMMLDLSGDAVFSVKETVEQIDDMIGSYGCENTLATDATTPTIPLEMKTVQEKINEFKNVGDSWGNSGW